MRGEIEWLECLRFNTRDEVRSLIVDVRVDLMGAEVEYSDLDECMLGTRSAVSANTRNGHRS